MVHVAGLVGRQAELEIFDHACQELEQGRPAALEVVGEPGIGKTRIAGELERRAESLGQLVLSGSASELERDLPLGVFVDALDDYVHSLDERRLVSLDDDVRKELAAIFPSLSLLAPRGTNAHNERYRSYRAVRELLDYLQRGSRLSSSSTTSIGLTRPRSSWSERCCGGHQRRPCSWRSRSVPASSRSASSRPSRAHNAEASSPAPS